MYGANEDDGRGPRRRTVLLLCSVAVVGILAGAVAAHLIPSSKSEPEASATPSVSPTGASAAPGRSPAGGPAKTVSGYTDCYKDPRKCGFPDSTNTGYAPTGVKLTRYSGPSVVSKNNTVIDGKLITKPLRITGRNVLIKNSKIVVPISGADPVSVDFAGRGGSATVVDTELSGGQGGVIGFNHWTGIRLDIHSFGGDGCKLGTGVTLRDSYIHDFELVPDAHGDGCQLQDGASDVLVKHNTIDARAGDSGLFLSNDSGPDSARDVTVTRNLLIDAGNYTMVLGDGHGRFLIRDVRITDNRLVHLNGQGLLDIADRAAPYLTFSGNVDDLTDAAVTLGPELSDH